MDDNALSMIGLALRAGRLEAGEEPAGDACRERRCRLLLVAGDAAGNTLRRAERFAALGQCLTLSLPCSRAELGAALGRGSCALAAVTDLGLAQAIVAKLARKDPERYGGTAERLRLKAERAALRREKKPGSTRRKGTAGRTVQYNRKNKK
jgi:ribosomal protein L7Ae-like RNA K-turn-binding protein